MLQTMSDTTTENQRQTTATSSSSHPDHTFTPLIPTPTHTPNNNKQRQNHDRTTDKSRRMGFNRLIYRGMPGWGEGDKEAGCWEGLCAGCSCFCANLKHPHTECTPTRDQISSEERRGKKRRRRVSLLPPLLSSRSPCGREISGGPSYARG